MLELGLGGGIRGHGNQQTGLDPLTVTVVSPEEDVRAVAGGGGLLELHFYLIRVSDGHLDAGLGFELLAYFGQAVVALVTVDPDGQLTFVNRSSG